MMKRKGSLGRIITNAEILDYQRFFVLKKHVANKKYVFQCFVVVVLLLFPMAGGEFEGSRGKKGSANTWCISRSHIHTYDLCIDVCGCASSHIMSFSVHIYIRMICGVCIGWEEQVYQPGQSNGVS